MSSTVGLAIRRGSNRGEEGILTAEGLTVERCSEPRLHVCESLLYSSSLALHVSGCSKEKRTFPSSQDNRTTPGISACRPPLNLRSREWSFSSNTLAQGSKDDREIVCPLVEVLIRQPVLCRKQPLKC